MEFLSDLLQNRVFMAAVMGWLVAQVLKTIIDMCINKSFDPERLVGSGGMPSSHSATVCALATAAHLDRLYGGDVQALVRTLADAGRLSFAAMETLARWLDARAAESPEYDYD